MLKSQTVDVGTSSKNWTRFAATFQSPKKGRWCNTQNQTSKQSLDHCLVQKRSKRFGFSFFLWPSIDKRRSLYHIQLPIHLSIQCPHDSCHLTCSKLSPIVNLGFWNAPHQPAPQTIKSSRRQSRCFFEKSPSYPCHKQWLRHCKQMCPMEQLVLAAAVILATHFALVSQVRRLDSQWVNVQQPSCTSLKRWEEETEKKKAQKNARHLDLGVAICWWLLGQLS